ncbi:MAG: hypothetical protein ACE5DL_03260 [Nitrosopumilaceae archaeon]
MLFGVFAGPSPESCPLNNTQSKNTFLKIEKKLKLSIKNHNITKLLGFYMSVLKHEWIIILDAKNAHDIETMCIDVGISSTNTVKIVPLNEFSKVVQRIKS